MSAFALYFSLAMTVFSLAWGWYEGGNALLAEGVLGFGLLWLLALIARRTWFSALGLFAAVVVASLGIWVGMGAGWMAAGAIGALLVWDLAGFRSRLRLAGKGDDLRTVERLHLTRLTVLALVGMALASLAMLAQLRFTFEWGALLLLVAALGVTQLIGWLRRGGE